MFVVKLTDKKGRMDGLVLIHTSMYILFLLIMMSITISSSSSPFVSGLSTPSSSSSSSSSTRTTTTSAIKQQSPEVIRQLARNWFTIVTHLQNPALYPVEWANGCIYNPTDQTLMTNRPTRKGQIVSLVPIHAIGLENMGKISSNSDWFIYDVDKDTDYFFSKPKQKKKGSKKGSSSNTNRNDSKHEGRGGGGGGFGFVPKITNTEKQHPQRSPFCYQIPSTIETSDQFYKQNPKTLFCDINPHRSLHTGWMGHLASTRKMSTNNSNDNDSDNDNNNDEKNRQEDIGNCRLVPIAPPLCALVSTDDMENDTVLVLHRDSYADLSIVSKLHDEEIRELQHYMNMAYPKPSREGYQHQRQKHHDDDDDENPSKWGKNNDNVDTALKYPFYDFPTTTKNIPNLEVTWKDPDIITIPNFLSDAECDALIRKAKPHLVPCVTKNPTTGIVEKDYARTSRNANIPQREVPTIIDKITKLAGCSPDQLEIIQILRYRPGQYFRVHTDGFSGPVSACGFENSARLVTLFCYLNDVADGGSTLFTELDLYIQPKKGTAVIHFPTTTGYEEDLRTAHEATPAIDEKWILVTWVWMHPRDPFSIYAEEYLGELDAHKI